MLKRIRLVLASAAVMVAMLFIVPSPAMAQDLDDADFVIILCDTDGDGFGDSDCGDVFGLGFFDFSLPGGVTQEISNESETGDVALGFTVS